jgi:hypothetical protein
MNDQRPPTTPARLLYGRESPVRGLGDRVREPQQSRVEERRRSDWIDQLRIPAEWRTGPWGPQR